MESRLITFLKKNSSYPHKPDIVEHIQTHISHVFIASPYVYKFKKAVDFGFLDYSSLAKRHTFCRSEVELNRRLSDDIYLGVVSVVEDEEDFQLVDEETNAETVVEYAVKMRKLQEKYFLHTYLEKDTLRKRHLDRVVDKLAHFYIRQQPDEEILKWGTIDRIRVNTEENFEQTKAFIGETITQNAYETIRYFTNQYFERNEDLFERRIAEKRIVDGHGDLHLEHIHITPEKVQIYDCIEFNERFRYGDLAVDLAFLAMDLDFNDCWQEERYFIKQMARKLDDPDLLQIIDFYKCYRAYVKGKVKSLQSTDQEIPKADREQAVRTASRYFNLSLRYTLLGSKPMVIVFMGGVGTGKSTLACHFEDLLGLNRFSSDCIRKQLVNLPLEERPPEDERKKLYSRPMSEKTYRTLFENMESELMEGKSVILDATFSDKSSRKKLIKRLEPLQATYLFIESRASDEVIKKRLKNREKQKRVVSDARLEDFDLLKKKYNPPVDIDDRHLIAINTENPLKNTLAELYTAFADKNIETD